MCYHRIVDYQGEQMTTGELKEDMVVRTTYSKAKQGFIVYTKREDNNGWRSIAKKEKIYLLNPKPHFYRGTQKQWLKGDMRWLTPFHFLEGLYKEEPSQPLTEFGSLSFDIDRDKNFIWSINNHKFELCPEKHSHLPSNSLLLAEVCDGLPRYSVFLLEQMATAKVS